jgi:hypothetical protein
LALLLVPLLAFVHSVGDWVPSVDVARMGIKSFEVGGPYTPLTGQPSTSAHYVEAERHVDHLGPLHFYLMAGPMRLVGPTVGMLSVSLAIVTTCVWLSVWAVFRRLGPAAGVLAAALVALVMFTTGVAALMNPVSSNIAGYPVFAAAVLLWCVMRGDLRLLPLATAVTAFAAQIHLSVLPAVAVLAVAGLVGLVRSWGSGGRWRERAARRQLAGWAGAAVAVGLVLWSPMVLQELTSTSGNLTNLATLTGDEERPTLGLPAAFAALVNVFGHPLLGRTDLYGNSGVELLQSPSVAARVSAAVVVSLVVLLAVVWSRGRLGTGGRSAREKAGLPVMVGVLAVAGLANTSSIVDSIEQWRLVFYHWVFPLLFFVCLTLGLGAVDWCRSLATRGWGKRLVRGARERVRPGVTVRLRPVAAGAAVAVIIVFAAANAFVDRPNNEVAAFGSPLERRQVDDLLAQVMEHEGRLDGPTAVLHHGTGGGAPYTFRDAVALYLLDRGLDVKMSDHLKYFVPDDRLTGPDYAGRALVVVHDYGTDWEEAPAGELVADVTTVDQADLDIYEQVLAAFEPADGLRFSPSLRARFADAPDGWVEAAEAGQMADVEVESDQMTVHNDAFVQLGLLNELSKDPAFALTHPDVLDMISDDSLAEPQVDPALLSELRRSEFGSAVAGRPTRLRVYLVDNGDLPAFGFPDNPFL